MKAWIESGLCGPGTAEQVILSKSYSKAMRAHKITIQAMWRILMPKIMNFIQNENPPLKQTLEENQAAKKLEIYSHSYRRVPEYSVFF